MSDNDEWVSLRDAARQVQKTPSTLLRWRTTRGVLVRKNGQRWQAEMRSVHRAAGTPLYVQDLAQLRERVQHLEAALRATDDTIAALQARVEQSIPTAYDEPLERQIDVARFLDRHIAQIKFKTLIDWADVPLQDGRAALEYAIEKTRKAMGRGKGRFVHQCHIPGCPCHSMDLPLSP